MKIWSGFSKLIRRQCNKGNVVDSIFLGTYFKENIEEEGENK